MANQITIDIVAQTQKLTSGINDANTQIDGMSSKLKGAGAHSVAMPHNTIFAPFFG